jgi:hypothetical protein
MAGLSHPVRGTASTEKSRLRCGAGEKRSRHREAECLGGLEINRGHLMTTRRAVFAGIAAALMPGPLAAQAPTQGGMRRLGVLMTTLATDPAGLARAAAFVQGLGALGWKEGGNLRIDWRWGGGDPSLFERYAAELVMLGPEVLMANARLSVAALRRETSTIPIVFVNVSWWMGRSMTAVSHLVRMRVKRASRQAGRGVVTGTDRGVPAKTTIAASSRRASVGLDAKTFEPSLIFP